MEQPLNEYAEIAIKHALDLGCRYCDVRSETISKNGIIIENGEIEHVLSHDESGIGIRILNGEWGFCSISNLQTSEQVKNVVEIIVKRTSKNNQKIQFPKKPAKKDKVSYFKKIEPTIEEITKIGLECDKIISSYSKIIKSTTSVYFNQTAKLFVNSEGSNIVQNYTDVISDLSATAHNNGLTESVNVTEGGRGGVEKITENNLLFDSAHKIAEKASQLTDAKPVKEETATVIMNPDFVSLLTHEILGHPSEADRVLGKEMAWAGGAWWSGMLNEQIGSEELNVFDDPTIEGSLGWYKYDDEGNQAAKTNLIENGILKKHMHSRETAAIFNVEPTANMRATSYNFMPLIRMACTCIGNGEWDPQDMIKEVKHGYLISNMKIPSIDMKRYNWSISCQYANKIEDGEVTDLLRDVIVMGVAPNFFKSIDACGRDFTVRPITNCGKGDPMQSMFMGNGGPSVRATATVKSVK